jgi:hypothetical protein
MSEACSWCGVAVDRDQGFRAAEPINEHVATFCRLEHVVPWVIQGARWEAGTLPEAPKEVGPGLGRCAHCASTLDDAYVLLIRHRGEHRICDAFCDADHLEDWAKAGGRWRGAA